jgi:hypothetical protein
MRLLKVAKKWKDAEGNLCMVDETIEIQGHLIDVNGRIVEVGDIRYPLYLFGDELCQILVEGLGVAPAPAAEICEHPGWVRLFLGVVELSPDITPAKLAGKYFVNMLLPALRGLEETHPEKAALYKGSYLGL